MKRINLSVPKELKDRMDMQPRKISWSKIASQAFEQKIKEIEAIERLRKSKERMLQERSLET